MNSWLRFHELRTPLTSKELGYYSKRYEGQDGEIFKDGLKIIEEKLSACLEWWRNYWISPNYCRGI